MLFFRSSREKARRQAIEWLRLAQKVHAYRCDVLDEKRRAHLEGEITHLRALIADKETDEATLAKAGDRIEPVLRATGGSFYPRKFLPENVEMLLVAAIVVIALRTFFFQPFKIPTNSMYPTYNGITAEVYLEEADVPSAPMRALRSVALGSGHRSAVAEGGGEILIPLTMPGVASVHPNFRGRVVPGRQWFILPGVQAQYTFFIGDQAVDLNVPMDFPIDWVVSALAGEDSSIVNHPRHGRVLRTGRRVEAGQFAFAFDILTGDQLFVDRMSYHFIRPKIGHPVVFLTDNIEGINERERGKYYIKRLVGQGGDTIQIREPVLYRNGAPIEGSDIFRRNAEREGRYPGYVTMAAARLPFSGERPVEIPENTFFVLGDNSPNSLDSRAWGFVPKDAMVGRAFFIYYPFSRRWGPSE